MKSLLAATAFVLALFCLAGPVNSNDDWANKLESMYLSHTEWWCNSPEKFIKFVKASNQYGPIIMEIPEVYGCKKTRIYLERMLSLRMIKAFNLPMIAVEAVSSDEGRVFTVVPVLPSMPFKDGVGA